MVVTCGSPKFKSTKKSADSRLESSFRFGLRLRRLHHQLGYTAISASIGQTRAHAKLYAIPISLFPLARRRFRQDFTETAGYNCILARFQHPNAHDDLIGIVGNAGTRLGRAGGGI